jgi:hypothetical protein
MAMRKIKLGNANANAQTENLAGMILTNRKLDIGNNNRQKISQT